MTAKSRDETLSTLLSPGQIDPHTPPTRPFYFADLDIRICIEYYTKLSRARSKARSGAHSADVVLSSPLLGDILALNHPLYTYSFRCWRQGMWAGLLAQPVLLLLFLLDH